MLRALASQVISLLDFTSLNEDDNEVKILNFVQRANTPLGPVAAICIDPQFVTLVRDHLPYAAIKIATVANFPRGDMPLEQTLNAISKSIHTGAQEIDVVMPYEKYLAGHKKFAIDYILACKEVCHGKALLKIILETGAFPNLKEVASASQDMIKAGADFLKTSTGKINVGATLEAAETMLHVIQSANKRVGFKAAGGVSTPRQAMDFIELAQRIMGKQGLCPDTFRIGASRLLDALLHDSQ